MYDLILIIGFRTIENKPERVLYKRAASIAAIYNSLENDIKVGIFIPEFFDNFDELPEAKAYGLSIFFYELEPANNTVEFIKNKYPDSMVFCGGIYPSRYPENVYEQIPNMDFIVNGNGIKPTRDILVNNGDASQFLPNNISI